MYKNKSAKIKRIISIFLIVIICTGLGIAIERKLGRNSEREALIASTKCPKFFSFYNPSVVVSERKEYFSDSNNKDILQLKFLPGTLSNSKALFRVINSEGKIIYAKRWNMSDMFHSYSYCGSEFENADSYPELLNERVGSILGSITVEGAYEYSPNSKHPEFQLLPGFEDILRSDAPYLIRIPIFEAQEGFYAIGYSPQKHKVVQVIDASL